MTPTEMAERLKAIIRDLAILISDTQNDESGNTTEGGVRMAAKKPAAKAKPKGPAGKVKKQ